MDQERREQEIVSIESSLLERQREHVTRLNDLEASHGFDLDVLTDMYGPSILRKSETSADILNKFDRLFEALSNDPRYICVAGVSKKLRSGCYGLGQEPKYDPVIRAAFFDQSKTRVELEYAERKADSQPGIFMKGIGSVIWPGSELPDPNNPTEVKFNIACPITAITPWATCLDIVKASDDGLEVVHGFNVAAPLGGNIGIWGYDWLEAQENTTAHQNT